MKRWTAFAVVLALAGMGAGRAAGGDHRCHTVRLSEVLRSLETGQELVEIEDDEATVKVWVE